MTLDEWLVTAAGSLQVDLAALADTAAPGGDVAQLRAGLLDLARDAAHGVARPAAPLTTFLLGLALGRGMTMDDAVAAVRRVLPPPGADQVSPSAP